MAKIELANTQGEPNWEQRRYEIAKDCIIALMPKVKEQAGKIIKGSGSFPYKTKEEISAEIDEISKGAVEISVRMAKALVATLR